MDLLSFVFFGHLLVMKNLHATGKAGDRGPPRGR